MKTARQIFFEYHNQPSDIEAFQTLEEMIDKNSRAIIEAAAKVCEKAPGDNRKMLARAIRRMGW